MVKLPILLVLQTEEKMQQCESEFSFKTEAFRLNLYNNSLEITMVILFVYKSIFILESIHSFHHSLKGDMTQRCPGKLALPSHERTWPPTGETAFEVDGNQQN